MTGFQKIWPAISLGSALVWGTLAASGARAVAATVVAHEPEAIAQIATPPEGYGVLHVNAASGSDADGDGSQLRPYKTIARALRLAEPDTLILLAGGTYSAESGETFPLQLRSLVTIQGMAGPNTADVVILGNGNYYSESNGMQNVTLLGADNAGIANVTISNPHPEGNGLWIEAGSPVIQDSAFYQNGANGVYIAGVGAPVIRGNYFAENGRAGLVIAGPSSALVEGNIFENTGTGITVAPDSSPQILDNRISSNLDGLIIHAEARPTLQSNQIAHNRRNSIVDYAAWTPISNLGPLGATQPPPPTVNAVGTGIGPVDVLETASETTTAAPVPETITDAGETTATLPDDTSSVSAETDVPAPAQPTVETSLQAAVPNKVSASTAETAALDSAIAEAELAIPTLPAPPAETASDAAPIAPEAAAPQPAEAEAVTAEAIATAPAVVSYRSLPEESLGDRLNGELGVTTSALEAIHVSFVSAVASLAALGEVDLSPVVEATRSLDLALPTAASSTPASEATELELRATDSLLAPLPARSDADLSVAEATFSEAIEIPVTPPPTAAMTKPAEAQFTSEDLVRDLTLALESGEQLPAVPADERAATNERATAPNDARLAVPDQTIPIGSGGSLPELFTAGAATALPNDGPPPPPSLAASLELNYKVLVTAPDAATQAAVRAQVPDAFRTRLQGQVYMQAGAYSTREEAQARLNQLQRAGLSAQIQEIQ